MSIDKKSDDYDKKEHKKTETANYINLLFQFLKIIRMNQRALQLFLLHRQAS